MRWAVVVLAVLATGPVQAGCGVEFCANDIAAADIRRAAERERTYRDQAQAHDNFLADNRAREVNRRLDGIQREIENTNEELRWQRVLRY